ncbi:MAG: thioredoxin fold domain-containing protein [Rhodospirillaceae bacterium]|nr:thioredoxin fold domain-containing protein [Rhodospirillaceae bacterium]MBT5245381.1 thioredoxin fold domain-containing protein [Rhodospirillaceae bacterium]MBT5562537.1 thioredoxin fold domain-containing protein [Rhodospirillaceae bacterium]MBT6242890.1 thioredoxin fold domain-containing protein [Rhodospirillaceae bacterium]
MRQVLRLAFLAVLLLIPTIGQSEYREESLDNDYQGEIEALAEEGKFLVLFFHQAGCPYCDKMRARVHPVAKVMDYFTDNFVMMESNIRGNLDIVTPDGTQSTEVDFAKKVRVRATPVFIFYDTDGTPALRTTGFLDPDKFLLAGKYVVEGVHKTKKSFFRYLQEQN